MHLKRLILHHFRNYEEASFEFCPHVNVIYGDNAQGKTSVIEAIYLLIVGSSFRTSSIQELSNHEASGFHVEVHFSKNGIEQKIKMLWDGKEKKIFYNHTACPSIASLLGHLFGICLHPNDDLIKGPPQARRKFLDILLSQADPLYIYHLTRYNRAMQQRNALLKMHRIEIPQGIELWEREMARSSVYLYERRGAISQLSQVAKGLFANLSGERGDLQIGAKTDLNLTEDRLMQRFKELREREMFIGATLTGPHRDELSITLRGEELRSFGSESQQRTAVTALRLASWHWLKNLLREMPITLIDDVGMSLDEMRSLNLASELKTLSQVFLTSTKPMPLPHARHFHIEQGSIRQVYERNI